MTLPKFSSWAGFLIGLGITPIVVVQQKIAMVVVEDPPGYRESRVLPPL